MTLKPQTISPVIRFWMNIGVAIATFTYVLDFSLSAVAMPYIAGSIGADHVEGTYIITAFQTGAAVSIIAAFWCARRYGLMRMMIVTLFLNALFALFSALGTNLLWLVISRFLQGVAAGMILPISQQMFVVYYPPDKKIYALMLWASMVTIAPVVGPLIGGFFCVMEIWRMIFFLQVPLSLLALCILMPLRQKHETVTKDIPFDWIGCILFVIAITALQIVLDKGQQDDWFISPFIVTFSVISLLAFSFLIVWEKYHTYPYVDVRLFKKPEFTLGMIILLFSYSLYYGTSVVTPLWLQTSMGYDALTASIPLIATGIGPLIGCFFTDYLAHSFRKNLTICFIIFALASFYTASFTTQVDLFHLTLSRFILGIGLLFYTLPIFLYCLRPLTNESMISGLGIFLFCRNFAGAIGSSLFTTLWERRSIFHHEAIIESVSPYYPQTVLYFDLADRAMIPVDQSLALLNRLTDWQATMLSYNDVQLVIGICALLLIIFIWITPTSKTSYLE